MELKNTTVSVSTLNFQDEIVAVTCLERDFGRLLLL